MDFTMGMPVIIAAVVVVVVLFTAIVNRYRRCPSDKILVIYGGSSANKKSAKEYRLFNSFLTPL